VGRDEERLYTILKGMNVHRSHRNTLVCVDLATSDVSQLLPFVSAFCFTRLSASNEIKEVMHERFTYISNQILLS
jgi:hypothetical protein